MLAGKHFPVLQGEVIFVLTGFREQKRELKKSSLSAEQTSALIRLLDNNKINRGFFPKLYYKEA